TCARRPRTVVTRRPPGRPRDERPRRGRAPRSEVARRPRARRSPELAFDDVLRDGARRHALAEHLVRGIARHRRERQLTDADERREPEPQRTGQRDAERWTLA